MVCSGHHGRGQNPKILPPMTISASSRKCWKKEPFIPPPRRQSPALRKGFCVSGYFQGISGHRPGEAEQDRRRHEIEISDDRHRKLYSQAEEKEKKREQEKQKTVDRTPPTIRRLWKPAVLIVGVRFTRLLRNGMLYLLPPLWLIHRPSHAAGQVTPNPAGERSGFGIPYPALQLIHVFACTVGR